jgi:3-oxoacyl-[acyl-carrier-protein] synthase-3
LSLKINKVSVFLPDIKLTNEMLVEKFPGTTADEITKKTGIKTRYRTREGFIMSDMAFEACDTLFKNNNIDRSKIDLLILTGHGYDYKAPITAAVLQKRLGLSKSCFTLDIPGGCCAYINGLAVCKGLFESGIAENAVLLTGDTPSFVIPEDHLELQSIFSDSATATHITKGKSLGYEKFVLGTDGGGYENLIVRHSSSRFPATPDYLMKGGRPNGTMEMKSTEIFLFVIKTVPPLVKDTLAKNNLTIDEIDFFVFHQANNFLLETLRKKLGIPEEKFFNNIEDTGNTDSSTIPIVLKELDDKKIIKRGMKILLAGFGIGYTWGATVIEY